MLTSMRIQNFKAWKDTGEIRLAPLTVIFGANSAGKSSLGHLLLAMKQTVLSADRKRALHLGDDNSLIDLGTFTDCLHNHDVSAPLGFSLSWKPNRTVEINDPISKSRFSGDELKFSANVSSDKNEQPQVNRLSYILFNQKNQILELEYFKSEQGKWEINSDQYRLVRTSGNPWALHAPDKFYRISDETRARFQNADFLNDLALQLEAALNNIFFLGPLRENPKRIYTWSGDTPESVGAKGEFTIPAILAARSHERYLNRGRKQKLHPFDVFIAEWLKELDVIESFSVNPLSDGGKVYEVMVKTGVGASEVKIADVGFGVSQVLPALVQAFYCPPHSTVWMEQPEIHLHPQVQAKLADVFISATKAGELGKERAVQLIIESHSEHFLNRLQRRVAEGVISPDKVAVYFCRRGESATELEPLRMNRYGEIENWPEHFFGNEMEDIAGRALAAADRKRKMKSDLKP